MYWDHGFLIKMLCVKIVVFTRKSAKIDVNNPFFLCVLMFLMWFNYFYGVYININFYRKTVLSVTKSADEF
jgi:hypothetical protein